MGQNLQDTPRVVNSLALKGQYFFIVLFNYQFPLGVTIYGRYKSSFVLVKEKKEMNIYAHRNIYKY